MRICVLGAGGLGSVIGGWLAESGVDVTLVGRPAHVEAIRKNGLHLTGIRGERVVTRLTAVTHPEQASGEFDFLFVTVKAAGTPAALIDANQLRGRVKTALSLQNTVCKDDDLIGWIGRDHVVGASTIEGGTIVKPGVVCHTGTAPTTAYFGELDGTASSRVDSLVKAFDAAGFAARAVDDIRHVEWEKLLQISLAAVWSASTFGALGGSFSQGLHIRPAAEHYVQLAREFLSISLAMGHQPADYYAPYSRFRDLQAWTFEEAVDAMTAIGRSMADQQLFGRPSLHDDLLRGRRTELSFSVGAWLAEADARGLAVPTVRCAYRIVQSLEQWMVTLGGVPSELPEKVVALGVGGT